MHASRWRSRRLMFELFIGEELIIPPHDPSAPSAALQQAQFDLQTQILDEIQTQFGLEYEPQNLAGEVGAVALFPG